MRSLSPSERNPVWSDLMGAEDTLIILGETWRESVYEPFLSLAERFSWQVAEEASLPLDEVAQRNLIFLGPATPLALGLFADPGHPETGFTLDVRRHPLAPDKRVALVSASARHEVATVVHRLSHYGKYGYLHFADGALLEKRVGKGDRGIRVTIETKPDGIDVAALTDFDRLADELASHRVVYLGETHTSRADHLLQAMLIEALFRRNPKLAIGMEMFPTTSQPALDAYIADGGMGEAEFLQRSRYHEVWNYDYRLFRPIFAFARKNRIPVVGLNVERDIVSSVFKSGSLAGLSEEQLGTVPPDRDLDLPRYRERLEATFRLHGDGAGSVGTLGGFLQAQAIWDEAMAKHIVDYLTKHPDHSMVVLAGSQHTRKDSGIPPRVARRLSVSQAVVANAATSSAEATALRRMNDYIFLLEAADFPPAGKIGIVLEERERAGTTEMVVQQVNPEAPAAEAGLRPDDILISIGGEAVATMQEVRLAMLGRLVGETVELVVERTGEDGTIREHRLETQLMNSGSRPPHP